MDELAEPAAAMLKKGALQAMRGIGEGSVHRIRQLLRTGSCDDLRTLRQRIPRELRQVLGLRGIGPSKARLLMQHLGISNLAQLEHAARSGAVARLPRMGTRAQEQLLEAIADHRKLIARLPLPRAERIGRRLVDFARSLETVQAAELVGSIRRGEETVGDIDLIAASDNPSATTAAFATAADFVKLLHRGESMVSAKIESGHQVDLWVLSPRDFGAGLHAYSGTKQHVVSIRDRAVRRGLHISEHGVFRRSDGVRLSGDSEEQVFAAVGLPYIPPELRQAAGEIEAAERRRLPKLITLSDLRGDLHMHTRQSDGSASVPEMARAAAARGLEYIAITDHSQSLEVARGLDERRLKKQLDYIRRLPTQDIELLAGVEVDILPNGTLDLDPQLLRQLDWVIGSVHAHFDLSREEMTTRVIRAMESGVVDCIGHPTGRRLAKRPAYELDLEAVFRAAKRLGVAVELNAGPGRLDLDAVSCRRARQRGVAISLNSDAHSPMELANIEMGIRVARRGWLEAGDVLNTLPADELLARRKDRMRRRGPMVVAPEALSSSEGSWSNRGPDAVPSPGEQLEPRRDVEKRHDLEPKLGAEQVADRERELGLLQKALLTGKIDPPLEQRLADYLAGKADDDLDHALARISENRLQAAFDALMRARLAQSER
jgi:DNA polymerase (family 10)